MSKGVLIVDDTALEIILGLFLYKTSEAVILTISKICAVMSERVKLGC
jgi:hypothetical protein